MRYIFNWCSSSDLIGFFVVCIAHGWPSHIYENQQQDAMQSGLFTYFIFISRLNAPSFWFYFVEINNIRYVFVFAHFNHQASLIDAGRFVFAYCYFKFMFYF